MRVTFRSYDFYKKDKDLYRIYSIKKTKSNQITAYILKYDFRTDKESKKVLKKYTTTKTVKSFYKATFKSYIINKVKSDAR